MLSLGIRAYSCCRRDDSFYADDGVPDAATSESAADLRAIVYQSF